MLPSLWGWFNYAAESENLSGHPPPGEAKEQKLWSGPLSLASLDSLIASSGVGRSLVPENLREFCPPAPRTFTLKEYQVSETAFEGRECFCFLLTQVVQLEAVCPVIYVLEVTIISLPSQPLSHSATFLRPGSTQQP